MEPPLGFASHGPGFVSEDVLVVVVVATVDTVAVNAVGLAPGVTVAGVTVHFEPPGAPAQLNCTAFGNVPPTDARLRLKVAVAPCATLCVGELAVTAKSTPEPEAETGIVAPFTAIAPLAAPEACGVKTTLTVHELPGAREAGQLLVSLKAPRAVIEFMT
jgi:hypothetical protein